MASRQEVEDSFEAVPAYIVADKRDKFGQRLGRAAFIILILYFLINGYIQGSKNGTQLDEARDQRASLIKNQELTFEGLKNQGTLIVQLQGIITRQNEALRKAGLPVEPIPNLQDLIDEVTKPTPSPSAGSSADPNRSSPRPSNPRATSSPQPRPTTKPKPSPTPSPKPRPTPSPTRDPVTQTVCQLTHVCL